MKIKTVVFKYFSCPAKSIKVITFEEFLQIASQSNDFAPCVSLSLTIFPLESKPKMSLPTELVLPLNALLLKKTITKIQIYILPDSISCL